MSFVWFWMMLLSIVFYLKRGEGVAPGMCVAAELHAEGGEKGDSPTAGEKEFYLISNRKVPIDSPEGKEFAKSHHLDGAVGQLASANKRALKHAHSQVFHPNHERLHAIIFFGLIVMIVCSQAGLWYWKTHHSWSFKRVTLAGVWLIPFGISVSFRFWRMICCWLLFTVLTGRIIWLARQKPLAKSTPRRVYLFFLKVYELSYGMAVFGYTLLLIEFLGFSMVLPALQVVTYYSVLLVFYGLYFGLLDRDCAEICSEYMSASMGIASSSKDKSLPSRTLSSNQCAVCCEFFESQNQSLGLDSAQPRDDAKSKERVFKLTCDHRCHESCIRGWCIVGKRDTCAACSEKVRLGEIFKSNPWLKTSAMWAQALDLLRYLIVWNPVIVTAIQVFVFVLDTPE